MVLLSAIVYVRAGCNPQNSACTVLRGPARIFPSGLATLWLAIGSPMDVLPTRSSAHTWWNICSSCRLSPTPASRSPQVPLLRGLPHMFTAHLIGPLFRMKRYAHWAASLPAAGCVDRDESDLPGWHVRPPMTSRLSTTLARLRTHLLSRRLDSFLVAPHPPVADERTVPGWIMLPYLVARISSIRAHRFLAFCGRPVYGITPNSLTLFMFR